MNLCGYLTKCVYFFPYCPHESPCRLSGIVVSLLQAGQCQIFSHYVLCELYERIQRDSCVTERGLSLLWDCLVFSLSLSRVKKTALSHVTSHFQRGLGSRAAEEHPARRATMPTFSLRALWLEDRRAEKSGSAGMCVHVYDYT